MSKKIDPIDEAVDNAISNLLGLGWNIEVNEGDDNEG